MVIQFKVVLYRIITHTEFNSNVFLYYNIMALPQNYSPPVVIPVVHFSLPLFPSTHFPMNMLDNSSLNSQLLWH